MATLTAGTSMIVDVLGGKKSFKGPVRTWLDLHRSIEQGLFYRAFEAVQTRYDITSADLTFILAIPSRTLARRKTEGVLRREESDRLVRLSRVGALAEEVLGSSSKAATWLHRPNRALNNETPLKQLDTDVGSRQVENLLTRTAYGVYS